MRWTLLSLSLLLISLQALAWGPTGHRVVGEIAEQQLTDKAKAKIMQVLGNESLAAVSIWMDEVKSDTAYNRYYDWHWVTIPNGQRYGDTEKNPNGDVVKAIEDLTAQLKSGKLSLEEEQFAIKALVHFVGDVHQPLHVGTGEDMGGNKVKVTWFKEETNLHHVWDSDMINYYDMSYTELASNLMRTTTKEDKMAWKKGDVRAWAHESMTYREALYEVGDGKLGYRYHYVHFPTVEKRLAQAGYRLGNLLNEIYD